MGKRRLLNVNQAAEYVGLAPGTIRNLISQGTLPFRYTKLGSKLLFDCKVLDKWIDSLPGYGGDAA